VGLGSYFYRTLFWKTLVKRKDYQVKSVKKTGSITEITLSPKGRAVSFSPGQFVFVSFFSSPPSGEPHPFTISSSSSKNELVLSIKELGDFTKNLEELKPGTNVKVEGPFGGFSFINHKSENYIFIAGGIGITPFLSMLRSISDSPESYNFENIDLYYSVKDEKEAVFLEELREISKKFPKDKKLNIFHNLSGKEGHLNYSYAEKNSKFLKDSQIFICGPPAMMKSLKKQLVSGGIRKYNIHMEEFGI
jgi:predicted ferric reductase